MKAVLSKTPGGPETLVVEERPDPQAKEGEVVIAIKACGVNYPDTLVIEDKYQFKPERPYSPGCEVAGVVESIGRGVKIFNVGDRVIASTDFGGMAEKIAVPESRCILMPDSMPFDEGSAFIFTYGTSHFALKQRAQLKANETLLVLGAAGGVGLAAVELGKATGARVIAACSTQDKVDLAIRHGADAGLVYPQGPFDREGQKALADLFKKACGPEGAHVIYDAVGGDYAEASLRAVAWEGRFLVIGFPAGIPKIPLNLTLLKSCQIVGVFWGGFTVRSPEENQENIKDLLGYYAAGMIKPFVSERFSLERAGDAIRHLGARKAMGKVVVVTE